MTKRVELAEGVTVEETFDGNGHPMGFLFHHPNEKGEFFLSAEGVIKLAEFMEHLVA